MTDNDRRVVVTDHTFPALEQAQAVCAAASAAFSAHQCRCAAVTVGQPMRCPVPSPR